MARDTEFVLTPEELELLRKKRKRMRVIAIVAVIVIACGALLFRPARHAIHRWQARRHAEHAFALIDAQKWSEARDEATAAYKLQYDEPEAVRALARLLSRGGQADGLEFWHKLAAIQPLTREDLRDQARLALRVNDLAQASESSQRLLDPKNGEPQAADRLIGAEVATRNRIFDRARTLAEDVLQDEKASRREQLQAAAMLDNMSRNSETSAAVDIEKVDQRLVTLSKGTDEASLDALLVLAARFATQSAPGAPAPTTPLPAEAIEKAIENHPAARTAQKLLANDLRIAQHPDQRAEIIQEAIDRYKKGDNADLLALAAWLYRNGEFQRLVDTIPLDRALQTRELFLQHVDALAAMGRWNDIRKIIETERFPLDPVIEHMYLARCFAQQGQEQGAANSWERALESAAGDSGKLVMLASYAEKNDAREVADKAYEAAAAVSPKMRAAQQGRLRGAYYAHDTKRIQKILGELLKIWPNDTAIINDDAYIRLLTMNDSPASVTEAKAIEQTASRLIKAEPASLPHRTLLALALLKQGRMHDALGVYQDLNVPRDALSASAVAVHASVMAAVGNNLEAKTEADKVPKDQLLPEEQQLLNKYVNPNS